jgi:hypothetical protein
MGLDIGELMAYWETRVSELARMADLERQIRILQIRTGDRRE